MVARVVAVGKLLLLSALCLSIEASDSIEPQSNEGDFLMTLKDLNDGLLSLFKHQEEMSDDNAYKGNAERRTARQGKAIALNQPRTNGRQPRFQSPPKPNLARSRAGGKPSGNGDIFSAVQSAFSRIVSGGFGVDRRAKLPSELLPPRPRPRRRHHNKNNYRRGDKKLAARGRLTGANQPPRSAILTAVPHVRPPGPKPKTFGRQDPRARPPPSNKTRRPNGTTQRKPPNKLETRYPEILTPKPKRQVNKAKNNKKPSPFVPPDPSDIILLTATVNNNNNVISNNIEEGQPGPFEQKYQSSAESSQITLSTFESSQKGAPLTQLVPSLQTTYQQQQVSDSLGQTGYEADLGYSSNSIEYQGAGGAAVPGDVIYDDILIEDMESGLQGQVNGDSFSQMSGLGNSNDIGSGEVLPPAYHNGQNTIPADRLEQAVVHINNEGQEYQAQPLTQALESGFGAQSGYPESEYRTTNPFASDFRYNYFVADGYEKLLENRIKEIQREANRLEQELWGGNKDDFMFK